MAIINSKAFGPIDRPILTFGRILGGIFVIVIGFLLYRCHMQHEAISAPSKYVKVSNVRVIDVDNFKGDHYFGFLTPASVMVNFELNGKQYYHEMVFGSQISTDAIEMTHADTPFHFTISSPDEDDFNLAHVLYFIHENKLKKGQAAILVNNHTGSLHQQLKDRQVALVMNS